jgi:hypothetical protein
LSFYNESQTTMSYVLYRYLTLYLSPYDASKRWFAIYIWSVLKSNYSVVNHEFVVKLWILRYNESCPEPPHVVCSVSIFHVVLKPIWFLNDDLVIYTISFEPNYEFPVVKNFVVKPEFRSQTMSFMLYNESCSPPLCHVWYRYPSRCI